MRTLLLIIIPADRLSDAVTMRQGQPFSLTADEARAQWAVMGAPAGAP